ncbi:MAG: hypothetical protein CVV64_04510 [Candidatus Wallbacteria bacterium HGW-Wallbacteria-1]|jgi:uncharacterized spore protein YtfJ|uniref:Sporulation protein YtfJ n=1 Tax=Candidatus Wallbacteria bacterium HGW-Wallbacteria-1 TaxID=2013854 RepID=A0A2N1PRS0_9BACT|nr:MAG: hypothetical protein CVV64_04510 [Candidatus Wallbacteria bacterium HGW-Wallbacteria-1]
MSLEDLARTVLQQLQETINTKTIVGQPIVAGETTVVPITKVSFGFGVGGKQEKDNRDASTFGGGSGGGATLEPMGFIVISDGDARLVPFNQGLTVWERYITPANVKMVATKIKEIVAARKGVEPQVSKTEKGAGQE